MAQNPPSESLGDPSKGTFGRQLYFPYCPLLTRLSSFSYLFPLSPTFHTFPYLFLPFHTISYLFRTFPLLSLLSLTSPTFAYFVIPFHICSYLFLLKKIGKHIKQVGTLMKSMKML